MKCTKIKSAVAILAGGLMLGGNQTVSAEPTSRELVDALNGVFGRHAGQRGSHAKGFCASGIFVPAASSSKLVESQLFSMHKVPATFRYSIGGGNPHASDKSKSVRGMAVKIHSDVDEYQLVLASEPVFFAATPESFVSFLEARVPDKETKKPDPAKVKAHSEKFPESKLLGELLAGHAAPASYATTPYFSNHAFHFQNSHGEGKWARVIIEPTAGTHYLTAEQEKEFKDDFLKEEFQSRLNHHPIEYDFYIQEATAADSIINPAQQWGNANPKLLLGKLQVNSIEDNGHCDSGIFSPAILPKGIAISDDPILKARSAAYAESFQRRSQ